jgi:GDP-4-dehydro-6-deoxy-D-mannose reductase
VSRRALVTGAAGFVGQWLCRALLADGWDVVGAGIAAFPSTGILSEDEKRSVSWTLADVRHQTDLSRVFDQAAPDAVFHLAGVTFVPEAQAEPALTYEINVLGAARLLHEVRARRKAGEIDPVVLVIGSAEQYGRSTEERPLREQDPQNPLTVYAASKASQEVVALEAARSEGVRVVATRSFNHSGPGQPEHFLLPALVHRVLGIRDGAESVLRIGNADTVRDFLHVRDVTQAYLALVERGAPGEVYNVCSGTGWRVRELAELVLAAADVQAEIVVEPALVRRVEVPWLVGDPAKIRATTAWSPTLSCNDIIADLINAATV